MPKRKRLPKTNVEPIRVARSYDEQTVIFCRDDLERIRARLAADRWCSTRRRNTVRHLGHAIAQIDEALALRDFG